MFINIPSSHQPHQLRGPVQLIFHRSNLWFQVVQSGPVQLELFISPVRSNLDFCRSDLGPFATLLTATKEEENSKVNVGKQHIMSHVEDLRPFI